MTSKGEGNLVESYPAIESIVLIYARHGFDVVRYLRAGEEANDVHMVQFLGDYPEAGFRAIEVANEHGLQLADAPLQKLWTVSYEDGVDGAVLDKDCPYWQIDFVPLSYSLRERIRPSCYCWLNEAVLVKETSSQCAWKCV